MTPTKKQMEKAKELIKKVPDIRFEEREKLIRQREYRRIALSRMYKGEELKVLRDQIKIGENGNPVQMKWNGMEYPLSLLKIEHDMVQDDYKNLMMKEEGLRQALIIDGLKMEEIEKVFNGTYKMKKKEDDKEKSNAKEYTG